MLQERFEDTKGAIGSCKSKDRQRTNNDLQRTTHKTKDSTTQSLALFTYVSSRDYFAYGYFRKIETESRYNVTIFDLLPLIGRLCAIFSFMCSSL
jgi:hypothetical protein